MRHYILLFLGLGFFPIVANGATTIEDKDVCFYQTYKNEKAFGIEENLLASIAVVETGRYNPKHGLKVHPWPWAVTSARGNFYFDSKAEAVAYVKDLQEQGVRSIDVGCMQVNLRLHGHNFASVEDAFSPDINTAYAAKFLKRLYAAHGSWEKAGVAYHSSIPEKAAKYGAKLLKAKAMLDANTSKLDIADLSVPQSIASLPITVAMKNK